MALNHVLIVQPYSRRRELQESYLNIFYLPIFDGFMAYRRSNKNFGRNVIYCSFWTQGNISAMFQQCFVCKCVREWDLLFTGIYFLQGGGLIDSLCPWGHWRDLLLTWIYFLRDLLLQLGVWPLVRNESRTCGFRSAHKW